MRTIQAFLQSPCILTLIVNLLVYLSTDVENMWQWSSRDEMLTKPKPSTLDRKPWQWSSRDEMLTKPSTLDPKPWQCSSRDEMLTKRQTLNPKPWQCSSRNEMCTVQEATNALSMTGADCFG